MVKQISQQFRNLWTASPPLAGVAILMLAALVLSVAGYFWDPRTITGVPAWLKPAKFALSTALFSGTVAWLFGYITIAPRFRRILGWVIAATLVLEVAIIDAQAARGTTSHFNIGTPLDASLFAIMGVAILLLWISSISVLVLLMRQTFTQQTWALALRSAMLITVLGSGIGALMTRTTREQKEARGRQLVVTENGGHTVGAPDGEPGLPVVGWSMRHGDLRVPHFLGLHAIQIVPFLAWLLALSPRGRRHAFALTGVVALSYSCLMAVLTWQALMGQPLLMASGPIYLAMIAWAGSTLIAVGALAIGTGGSHERQPDLLAR